MSVENNPQTDQTRPTLLEQMRSTSPAFVDLAEQTKAMLQNGEPLRPEDIESLLITVFFMGYENGVSSTEPDEEEATKQVKRR